MNTFTHATPLTIEEVKAQARRLMTAMGGKDVITHTQALELVAKSHAFQSWGELRSVIAPHSARATTDIDGHFTFCQSDLCFHLYAQTYGLKRRQDHSEMEHETYRREVEHVVYRALFRASPSDIYTTEVWRWILDIISQHPTHGKIAKDLAQTAFTAMIADRASVRAQQTKNLDYDYVMGALDKFTSVRKIEASDPITEKDLASGHAVCFTTRPERVWERIKTHVAYKVDLIINRDDQQWARRAGISGYCAHEFINPAALLYGISRNPCGPTSACEFIIFVRASDLNRIEIPIPTAHDMKIRGIRMVIIVDESGLHYIDRSPIPSINRLIMT